MKVERRDASIHKTAAADEANPKAKAEYEQNAMTKAAGQTAKGVTTKYNRRLEKLSSSQSSTGARAALAFKGVESLAMPSIISGTARGIPHPLSYRDFSEVPLNFAGARPLFKVSDSVFAKSGAAAVGQAARKAKTPLLPTTTTPHQANSGLLLTTSSKGDTPPSGMAGSNPAAAGRGEDNLPWKEMFWDKWDRKYLHKKRPAPEELEWQLRNKEVELDREKVSQLWVPQRLENSRKQIQALRDEVRTKLDNASPFEHEDFSVFVHVADYDIPKMQAYQKELRDQLRALRSGHDTLTRLLSQANTPGRVALVENKLKEVADQMDLLGSVENLLSRDIKEFNRRAKDAIHQASMGTNV